MRRFPLRLCVFRVGFVPVPLFSCDNWLALVRGNLGDGLPVPGRTGGVHLITWTIEQNHTNTNKLMAIKAFMLAWALTLFQNLKWFIYEIRLYLLFRLMCYCLFFVVGFWLRFALYQCGCIRTENVNQI